MFPYQHKMIALPLQYFILQSVIEQCGCLYFLRKMISNFVKLLLCLVIFTNRAESAKVSFYNDSEFRGVPYEPELDGSCHDLPSSYRGSISSINTHGQCVYLHSSYGCARGDLSIRRVRVAPGTPCHNWLGCNAVAFNDRAVSYRRC